MASSCCVRHRAAQNCLLLNVHRHHHSRGVAAAIHTNSNSLQHTNSIPHCSSSYGCSSFQRYFSSSSSSQSSIGSSSASKLMAILQEEISHEKSSYEAPANVKDFLKKGGWSFLEKDGDVNMSLSRELEGGKKLTVEFQLVSPFESETADAQTTATAAGGKEEEERGEAEMTDFTVSIQKKDASGVTFYCSTLQNDENFRYMIGNVRQFQTEEQRTSVSSYNGPEFEDLDEKLQEALDAWLDEIGVNNEMCDFIDAMAVDKEQKEYMYWLQTCAKVLQ
eukprot:GHVS01019659.1.p1 GENE.GHVS01019659.1~~GHVS01019659.1.p1  ORF type:complete len:278 (+),score=82.34 GHVS01019659.1:261-1094(+)